ncbi:MAG: flavodoxin domain-containing protein [Solirubrobacterales bacterium]
MKVLVAYASKRGSTAEIAAAVAAAIRDAGLEADCVETGEVKGLEPYDAVVLGSAVYAKRWRGEARHFLRKHRKQLAAMPFWIFSSGPVGDPEEDNESWMEPRKVVAEAEGLGARGHVVFGGAMPKEPQGFVEKAMVRSTPEELRDRRDWDEIRTWAEGVAREAAGA